MEAGKEGGGRAHDEGKYALVYPCCDVLVSPSVSLCPSTLTTHTHIAMISDTEKEAPKDDMIHQDPLSSPQWCQLTESGPLKELITWSIPRVCSSQHTQEHSQGPEGSQGSLTRSQVVELEMGKGQHEALGLRVGGPGRP